MLNVRFEKITLMYALKQNFAFIVCFLCYFLNVFHLLAQEIEEIGLLNPTHPIHSEILEIDADTTLSKAEKIEAFDIIQQKAFKSEDNFAACVTLIKLIDLSKEVGQLSEGKFYYQKVSANCLSMLSNNLKGELFANMGVLAGKMGDITESIDFFLKASDEFKADEKFGLQARNLVNAALSNYQIGEYETAVTYLKLAQEVLENESDVSQIKSVSFYINDTFIYVYSGLRDFESARRIIKNLENIALGKQEESRFLSSVSLFYLFQGKPDSAYIYLDKISEVLSLDKANFWSYLNNEQRKAGVLYDLGRYHEAVNVLLNAMPIAVEKESKLHVSSFHYELGYNYFQLENFKSSAEAFMEHIELNQELYDEEKVRIRETVKAEYDLNLKNEQILLLEKTNELNQIKLKAKNQFQIFLITFIVVFGIFLFMLWQSNKKIDEKNRQLITQTQKLNELNSINRKVFSIIGHDVRSPLNDLEGLTNLLGSQALSNDELSQISVEIDKKLIETQGLLKNILSWGVLLKKGVTIHKRDINVYEEIAEVLESFSIKIESKHLKTEVNLVPEATLTADLESFKFVLRNLMSNAIKFSPKGGLISVAFNFSDSSKGSTLIISDQGIGMPTEVQANLFTEAEVKRRRGTENEAGAGIGLTLVKEVCDLNNWEINVVSKENQGTSFSITFPQV
jgi:signal transduction histidine kinase